ncbi:hypothetical protein AMTR_s00066p00096170 [Amborella trichopoda]|uniref:Uncharacterized protein n=1 Tax=Amborella trichopoda TaxID=13333 RepID=U5DFD3_AMBTC|nr:hypothetical protein AMTR_s00066p00096170 [Amborella trichopoda]
MPISHWAYPGKVPLFPLTPAKEFSLPTNDVPCHSCRFSRSLLGLLHMHRLHLMSATYLRPACRISGFPTVGSLSALRHLSCPVAFPHAPLRPLQPPQTHRRPLSSSQLHPPPFLTSVKWNRRSL